MKVLKYVLKTLTVIAICCFVLFCAAKIVKGAIMKQPVAHTFGYATVTIANGAGSMSPTLNPTDTILIKKQKTYEVGDVITFTDDIGLVTHRIVEVTDRGYITKGDNPVNSVDGNVVTNEMIQGKMVSDGALSGFSKFMLGTWGLLTITLIITGAYLAVNAAFDKNNKKQKEEQEA